MFISGKPRLFLIRLRMLRHISTDPEACREETEVCVRWNGGWSSSYPPPKTEEEIKDVGDTMVHKLG